MGPSIVALTASEPIAQSHEVFSISPVFISQSKHEFTYVILKPIAPFLNETIQFMSKISKAVQLQSALGEQASQKGRIRQCACFVSSAFYLVHRLVSEWKMGMRKV